IWMGLAATVVTPSVTLTAPGLPALSCGEPIWEKIGVSGAADKCAAGVVPATPRWTQMRSGSSWPPAPRIDQPRMATASLPASRNGTDCGMRADTCHSTSLLPTSAVRVAMSQVLRRAVLPHAVAVAAGWDQTAMAAETGGDDMLGRVGEAGAAGEGELPGGAG